MRNGEHLAAKEVDPVLRGWWRPKTEFKQVLHEVDLNAKCMPIVVFSAQLLL